MYLKGYSLFLLFLLTVFSPILQANTSYYYPQKIAKPSSFLSKKSLLLGTVVVSGVVIYKYKTNIKNIIDSQFYSNKPRNEIKNTILNNLSKKISQAKTIEKRNQVILEIQDYLKYYIVIYEDYPVSKLSNDILIQLGIMDADIQQQILMNLSFQKEALRIINKTIATINSSKGKFPLCNRGSIERNYIYTDHKTSAVPYRNLEEWEVDSYGNMNAIIRKYNLGVKKNSPSNGKIIHTFEKDHIPSKAAIKVFLANRDNNGKIFNSDVEKNITNNATAVALLKAVHKEGRTNRGKNIPLIPLDSVNLEKATIKDFMAYYIYYMENGLNDSNFKQNWTTSLFNVYSRNKALCLYEKR